MPKVGAGRKDRNPTSNSRNPSINKISPGILSLAVDIDTLTMDPDNARLHPERNKESIRQSLSLYGQVKPIVVRRFNGVVIAGNGTLQAARELGWTRIAANFVDMDDVSAVGLGLADNRTAELARWDFEVVSRLENLLKDQGRQSIGWTDEELEVIRSSEWVPPEPAGAGDGTSEDAAGQTSPNGASGAGSASGSGNDSGSGVGAEGMESKSLVVGFTPDQMEVVSQALCDVRDHLRQPNLGKDDCLVAICREWLQSRKPRSSKRSKGARSSPVRKTPPRG